MFEFGSYVKGVGLMSSFFVHGHFVVLTSYTASTRIVSLQGMRRVALIEMHDPDGKIPTKIDRRLKNYKRMILSEDNLTVNASWGYKMIVRTQNRYLELAKKFENYWPLHILLREWPLPREEYFEWPDHLKGLDK